MGIDRSNGNSDEPDDADQGSDQVGQPEHRTPADRPGEPGYPSRADSRRAAMEANEKRADATAETNNESGGSQGSAGPVRETSRQDEQDAENRDGTSQEHLKESNSTALVPDTDRRQTDEQKPKDSYVSPLERMPSYGGFANLAEEFAARSASRETVRQDNAANEKTPLSGTKPDREATKLDEESIKQQIDPIAPDHDKAEASKEPYQPTVRDKDAEWTDGVDGINDLPTGDKLAEGDDSKASTFDRFRTSTRENVDTLTDQTEKGINSLDKIFGPRPTGHPETRTDTGPSAVNAHHAGIDVGTAASSLLTLGIVGAEATGWILEKIRRRRSTDGEGHR